MNILVSKPWPWDWTEPQEEVRQVAGRAQMETGQKEEEVVRRSPGKPNSQEELQRNQEKMALHSPRSQIHSWWQWAGQGPFRIQDKPVSLSLSVWVNITSCDPSIKGSVKSAIVNIRSTFEIMFKLYRFLQFTHSLFPRKALSAANILVSPFSVKHWALLNK